MPHAVENSSFLMDDSGQTLSANAPRLDVPLHLQNPYEKSNGVNGSTNHFSRMAVKSALENRDADADAGVNGQSQGHGHGNSHLPRAGSLSSLPNGRKNVNGWDQRSLHNEETASMRELSTDGEVGRSAPTCPPRQVNGDGSYFVADDGVEHTAVQTLPSRPSQTINGDAYSKQDSAPSRPNPNPQSTGSLIYTTSLFPSPPMTSSPPESLPATPFAHPGPRAANKPSHRFSSPASCSAPNAPSSHSSPQHPGITTLKHRHTLQVPKTGASRTSTSREDDSHGGGRFSPISTGVRSSLNLTRRHTQSLHSNMQHDGVPPDEDAVRWAEAVRQKRASKRKRRDGEDDDRVVMGTKVDQNHVNWVTAYNMLTGIRFTVSRTNAKLNRPLTDADFEASHKFSFDITGNELTPSAKYDFKFKDYAPWVFRHLRAKFKLDPADYLMSLTSKYILSELGSPGKSGSFFYFSRDYKYIIKTIHHAEHKFLRKVLREYYQHIEDNPNTLLSQFYGLHRVKIPYGRKIHFVIMNNLFPPHRDIHQTFDLKGSTVGRDFKEDDLEKNPRATMKDLNWLRRNLHLEFGPERKRLFIEQMERDVQLLQRLNIMDYSMLVGIHDLRRGNQENLRDKTLQVFQPGIDVNENPAENEKVPEKTGLHRTPSKLERARKARELRQMIKQEKPIPMGQSSERMPEQMEEAGKKRDAVFYSDDGGYRASHEDGSLGDEIFFLSIIDCLTHYGMVKKVEHLWKGLSHDKRLISPIAPAAYGDRFRAFIEGITKCPEEAARETIPIALSQDHIIPPEESQENRSLDGISLSKRKGSNSISHGERLDNEKKQMHRTSTSNSTWQRSEVEVVKSLENEGSLGGGGKAKAQEEENRVTTPVVVRNQGGGGSQGAQGVQAGQVLPVVEEAGESTSVEGTGGSGNKYESVDVNEWGGDGVDGNARGKRPVSRQSLDKELPPLPLPLPDGDANGSGRGRQKITATGQDNGRAPSPAGAC